MTSVFSDAKRSTNMMPWNKKEKKKEKTKSSSSSEGPKEIGAPTMVKHNFHVGFDNVTGDFVGLPPQWAALLQTSQIT